jgi:hypothetical protein
VPSSRLVFFRIIEAQKEASKRRRLFRSVQGKAFLLLNPLAAARIGQSSRKGDNMGRWHSVTPLLILMLLFFSPTNRHQVAQVGCGSSRHGLFVALHTVRKRSMLAQRVYTAGIYFGDSFNGD